MVTKQRTAVNEDLMLYKVESYNRYGGFENGQSSIEVPYMDEQLQTSMSALRQLSPPSQELVVNLIRQLAERENITVPLTPSAGLQTPADGMELWEAHLTAQNWSRNTIKTYKTLLTTYLRDDPTPTTLSIKQNLAKWIGARLMKLHKPFIYEFIERRDESAKAIAEKLAKILGGCS